MPNLFRIVLQPDNEMDQTNSYSEKETIFLPHESLQVKYISYLTIVVPVDERSTYNWSGNLFD